MVRANDTVALIVINQLSPVYVTFSVPGRYLSDIRRFQARQPLTVTAISAGGSAPPEAVAGSAGSASSGTGAGAPAPSNAAATTGSTRGVVSFIDNAVDQTTGTIRLKGTFPNGDRQLWPGVFVQVTLELVADSSALVVPATAVQVSQDGQYVYVVKADRTVEMRPVRAERQQGNQIVITDGVSAGEVVVTDGHLRLTPGARVTERGESGGGRGPGVGRGDSQPRDTGGH